MRHKDDQPAESLSREEAMKKMLWPLRSGHEFEDRFHGTDGI